jgi:pyruvate dehydrogenase E1 component alpha subunit
MLKNDSSDRKWKLFETMLLMRRFEERVIELHESSAFGGHYHVYIGQEATGAVAMSLLTGNDHICTTHRNHGHLIARGVDVKLALAEILGRATGLNGGYAGTFHLTAPQLGFLSTSGIVGGAISLSVGGAFACRQRGNHSVTMSLFGDGALEEGVAFEALNLAALWKLPLIFLCENNDAEVWTGNGAHSNEHAVRDLCDLPRLCGIETRSIAGLDVAELEKVIGGAIEYCRAGRGPYFVEVRTSRWPGNKTQFPSNVTGVTNIGMAIGEMAHDGPFSDWFQKDDPVLRLARELCVSTPDGCTRIARLDEHVTMQMDEAVAFAVASATPVAADALRYVFV